MEKSKIVSFWKEIEQAKRIAIGGLLLGDLQEGKFKFLNEKEVNLVF